jgi:purine-nucleoside phosphorylase
MKIVAFSCITNAAAGMLEQEINHEEVMEVGKRAGELLSELILRLLPRLASAEAGSD